MVLSHKSPIKSRPVEARQGLELQRKLWPEPNAWPSYQGQYGRGGFSPWVARGGVSALSGELKCPCSPHENTGVKMEACVSTNPTKMPLNYHETKFHAALDYKYLVLQAKTRTQGISNL